MDVESIFRNVLLTLWFCKMVIIVTQGTLQQAYKVCKLRVMF